MFPNWNQVKKNLASVKIVGMIQYEIPITTNFQYKLLRQEIIREVQSSINSVVYSES